jgi:hypothetical protein
MSSLNYRTISSRADQLYEAQYLSTSADLAADDNATVSRGIEKSDVDRPSCCTVAAGASTPACHSRPEAAVPFDAMQLIVFAFIRSRSSANKLRPAEVGGATQSAFSEAGRRYLNLL